MLRTPCIAYSYTMEQDLERNDWQYCLLHTRNLAEIVEALPEDACCFYRCYELPDLDCYLQEPFEPVYFIATRKCRLANLPDTEEIREQLRHHIEWKKLYRSFYLCGKYCFPVTLAKKKRMKFLFR